MPKNATVISLTDEERCYLESLVSKETIEATVYRRAKILLLKSEEYQMKPLPKSSIQPFSRFGSI